MKFTLFDKALTLHVHCTGTGESGKSTFIRYAKLLESSIIQ